MGDEGDEGLAERSSSSFLDGAGAARPVEGRVGVDTTADADEPSSDAEADGTGLTSTGSLALPVGRGLRSPIVSQPARMGAAAACGGSS